MPDRTHAVAYVEHLMCIYITRNARQIRTDASIHLSNGGLPALYVYILQCCVLCCRSPLFGFCSIVPTVVYPFPSSVTTARTDPSQAFPRLTLRTFWGYDNTISVFPCFLLPGILPEKYIVLKTRSRPQEATDQSDSQRSD